MKYNITLNQPMMIKYNLNVTQWCILDIISIAPTWCEAINKDGEIYFWIARQKIAEELKALDLKADTIYRNMKKLVQLGFLEYEKLGKKDLLRLSKKGKDLFISTMSDMNPNHYVGNESENNSDINPTYTTTNINNSTSIKEKKKEKESEYISKTDLEQINNIRLNKNALNEWVEYKNFKYKKLGLTKLVNMLIKQPFDIQQEIVDNSIMNNYQGLFAPKQQNAYQDKKQGTKDAIKKAFEIIEQQKDTVIDYE